jgi:hypothetical protein
MMKTASHRHQEQSERKQRFRHSLHLLVLIAMIYGCSGCATISGYSNQRVRLQSSPNGADVTITDSFGMTVFSGQTPIVATLPAASGYAFSPPRYTASFTKKGYSTEARPILGVLNGGWYIVGNLFSFGWIGWGVDAFTGAMWLLPNSVVAFLPASSQKEALAEGTANNSSSGVLTQQSAPILTVKDSLVVGQMIDEEAGLDPYKPTKVDREPRFDSRELQANLVYPNELRENGKNGYIGHVEALVLVSKEGSVKKILVETPDDRRFNVAALNALKLLAFSPAEIGATPVPYWASIILVFRMR